MIPLSIKSKREWKDPKGYRFLAAWSNSVLLEVLIRKFTLTIVPPIKSPNIPLNSFNSRSPFHHEYRLKTQLDDAGRSVISNIVEGFKRPTTKEYLEFLGFSQGSLEEVRSDSNRSLQNGLIKSIRESSLQNIGIDLAKWNKWCQDPKNENHLLDFPLREFYGNLKEYKGQKPKRESLKEINGEDLTYEIFIELINKTDYLLRNLVISLQKSGDFKENLRKNPWMEKEREFDQYLAKILKKK